MSDTTTTDAIPTSTQVWHALRILFGPQLLDASVVVLTKGGDPAGHDVTFITYAFRERAP